MNIDILSLQNLRCSGCSKKIAKELSKLSDVNRIEFNAETKELSYSYVSPDTPEQVNIKIKEMGYPLSHESKGANREARITIHCPAGKLHEQIKQTQE